MADLSGLRATISLRIVEIADAALADTLSATLDAAPERSGALKALTDTSGPELDGDFVARGTIFCAAPYAGYTDEGTPPHPIFGNPYLAFYWDRIGKFMVLRSVNHPGTQGTHWFDSGEDGGEPMRSRWAAAVASAAAA